MGEEEDFKSYLDLIILLLEVRADSGDRSSRSDSEDASVNLASSLPPDLRAGREVVNLRVSRVVELK